MKNNYESVEKISNQGYDLEFGTVLENTFNNYKKIAGLGGLAMLIIVIVVCVFFFAIIGVSYGFGDLTNTLTGLSPEFMSGSQLLVFFGISVIMGAVMAPINAGFIKMAYQAHHNNGFGIGTVFEYYRGIHFRELFIAGAIIAIIGNGGNYLLNYLGLTFWGSLFSYTVAFFTFLAAPLIIFSNLNATQAINMSVKLVLKQPLLLFGLLIVAVIFVCLGLIGFCIGIFFTIPFLYSMYFTIYTAIIPSEDNLLDEIGQHEE